MSNRPKSHPENIPAIDSGVLASSEPVLLPGLVSDWPLVKAALASEQDLLGYLRERDDKASVGVFIGDPKLDGRVFYNQTYDGFGFQRAVVPFSTVLDKLEVHAEDSSPPMIYVGSTTLEACLSGVAQENAVDLGDHDPLISIWIGNRARIAPHFDVPQNLACVAAGRRRFTLFPPDQARNLYLGPLDFTPAGQPISLVDVKNPDFEKFPRYREALARSRTFDLKPGDALYIPSMWWHHVEGLDPINILINYWWQETPAYLGRPMDAFQHALLGIRHLPQAQRQAWKALFDTFVFDDNTAGVEHIPEHARGILDPADEKAARRARAQLLNGLNR